MIDLTVVNGLQWSWIGLQVVVPMAAALLLAWPLWRSGQPLLGNIAGAGILFGAALVLMLREHGALDQAVQACLQDGTTCWPVPSAFTRYAIYAFIGLGQVMALFTMSVSVETRRRRRGYAPEWR